MESLLHILGADIEKASLQLHENEASQSFNHSQTFDNVTGTAKINK